jgi:hypothetical protein
MTSPADGLDGSLFVRPTFAIFLSFDKCHDVRILPSLSYRHRWRHAQLRMHPDEIVIHHMKRHGVGMAQTDPLPTAADACAAQCKEI